MPGRNARHSRGPERRISPLALFAKAAAVTNLPEPKFPPKQSVAEYVGPPRCPRTPRHLHSSVSHEPSRLLVIWRKPLENRSRGWLREPRSRSASIPPFPAFTPLNQPGPPATFPGRYPADPRSQTPYVHMYECHCAVQLSDGGETGLRGLGVVLFNSLRNSSLADWGWRRRRSGANQHAAQPARGAHLNSDAASIAHPPSRKSSRY